MLKHYEMLCVLPGTLAEDELAPMVQSISQVLGNYNAQHVSVEDMGKSRLAYPIKNIRYGYFQLFRFELEATDVSKMEQSIRLLGNLLRVVIQVSDPSKEKMYTLAADPTALSAPKKERGEGDRGDRRPARNTEPKTEEVVKQPAPVEEKTKEVPAPAVAEAEKTTEETVAEEPKVETKPKRASKKKADVSLDDIGDRLDEILQQDIDKV